MVAGSDQKGKAIDVEKRNGAPRPTAATADPPADGEVEACRRDVIGARPPRTHTQPKNDHIISIWALKLTI